MFGISGAWQTVPPHTYIHYSCVYWYKYNTWLTIYLYAHVNHNVRIHISSGSIVNKAMCIDAYTCLFFVSFRGTAEERHWKLASCFFIWFIFLLFFECLRERRDWRWIGGRQNPTVRWTEETEEIEWSWTEEIDWRWTDEQEIDWRDRR